MSKPATIDDLLRSSQKIFEQLQALNSAAKVGSPVRQSRGGDVARSGDKTVDDSFASLNKQLNKSGGALESFRKAIFANINTGREFKNRLEELSDEIGDAAAVHQDIARKSAKATLDLIKQQGLNSEEVIRNSRGFQLLSEGLKNYRKHQESLSTHTEKLIALEAEKVKLEARGKDPKLTKDRKQALDEQLETLRKTIIATTNAAVAEENTLRRLEPELEKFCSTLDSSSIILQGLNKAEIDLITSGQILGKSQDRLSEAQVKATEKLNAAINASQSTLAGVTRESAALQADINKQRQAMGAQMANFVMSATPVVAKGAYSNWLMQIKNGIIDSHYAAAAAMGMSDGELSNVVGANRANLAMGSRSFNVEGLIDSGAMDRMGESMRIFGLTGKEASEASMRIAAGLVKGGIGPTEATVAAQVKDVDILRHSLQMTSDQALAFNDSIAESGALASYMRRIDETDVEKRRAMAMQQITLQAQYNKALGKSTEQLIEQQRYAENTRYSGIKELFMKQIGGDLAIRQAEKDGMTFTPEEKAAFHLMRKGQATGEQQAIGEAVHERLLQRQADRNLAAGKSMGMNGGRMNGAALGLMLEREVVGGVDFDLYSAERMKDVDRRRQAQLANFGSKEAVDKFLQTGNFDGQFAVKTGDALALAPKEVDAYKSSLQILGESAMDAAEALSAISKNPAGGVVASGAMSIGRTILEGAIMGKVLQGTMGGAAGGKGGGILKALMRNKKVAGIAAVGAAIYGGGLFKQNSDIEAANPEASQTGGPPTDGITPPPVGSNTVPLQPETDLGVLGNIATMYGASKLIDKSRGVVADKSVGMLSKVGKFITKAPLAAALGGAAIGTYRGFTTDTGDYADRFGIDHTGSGKGSGILNSLYGIEKDDSNLMVGWKEFNIRAAGVFSDVADSFVENISFGFIDPIDNSKKPSEELKEAQKEAEENKGPSIWDMAVLSGNPLFQMLAKMAENSEKQVEAIKAQTATEVATAEYNVMSRETALARATAQSADYSTRRDRVAPPKIKRT